MSVPVDVINRPQNLIEHTAGQIWTKIYYIKLAGGSFTARTTILKLNSGHLWVHSPGPLDEGTKSQLETLGQVKYIIAPGTYHHMYVPHWTLAYPDAKLYVCPGLDVKREDIKYTAVLNAVPEQEWTGEIEQILIQGRLMSEVIFFHRPSSTVIVTDMVEYMTEESIKSDGLSQQWGTWLWTNLLMMKNKPLPAPEYRMGGFPDPGAVSRDLAKVITEWKPVQVILSHGQLIEGNPAVENCLRMCWDKIILDKDKPTKSEEVQGDNTASVS